MKRICTICARGGSKGVKNKNIRPLLGRPLIAHTLVQAKKSELFSAIAVSSDSDVILEAGRQWGADYSIKRPAHLATDETSKFPAIEHCIRKVERLSKTCFDTIVDMDVTSPLREIQDIYNAVHLLESKKVSNVITAMPARRSPYFNLVELDENGVPRLSKPLSKPIVRRQDSPPCFDMNASIYAWNREAFFKKKALFYKDTQLYVMPPERSIDIDSELDLLMVEFLLTHRSYPSVVMS